jgi:hypothetical protein
MRHLVRIMLLGTMVAIAPTQSWAAEGAHDPVPGITGATARQTAPGGFNGPVTGTPISQPGISSGSGTPDVGQPIWIIQIHF